jgi:undecaprenyl diphosphate synthase
LRQAQRMGYQEQIIIEKLPEHLAIIMDGNGRWAKQHGKLRTFGHQAGVKAVRDITEACAEIGIKYLTLYTFSAENWKRPQYEVNALMDLLVKTVHRETPTLLKNEIRLRTIGDISRLPGRTVKQLERTIAETASMGKMTLTLALNYSARWEILEATKKIAGKVKAGILNEESISEEVFNQHLSTSDFPDPELLIRTSGELRISNYLLWQIAYSELYFSDKLWPDFSREDLYSAIVDYQRRERRFGVTSEQLVTR